MSNDEELIKYAPVVYSEWLKKDTDGGTLAICKNCKYPVSWWHKNNYCPSCGAKMDMSNGKVVVNEC